MTTPQPVSASERTQRSGTHVLRLELSAPATR